MQFTGIDGVTFGVEDLDLGTRFFSDWGLTRRPGRDTVFETLDGGTVELQRAANDALPAPIEDGSTIRTVTWGLADADALRALGARIAGSAGFAETEDGFRCQDPNGMTLNFRISQRRPVSVKGSPQNTIDHNYRVDARDPVYDHAEPTKIGHVVFFAPDVVKAVEFYTEVLGFHVSDCYPEAGYFLRCREEGGHHDMFLLQTPDRKRGLNHLAFTVRDINEVFGGGIDMNRKGWTTQVGPGRHPISSAFFWYVDNPCGGLAEYYANEDYCTANWRAEEWKRGNANYAEWAISGGIDPKTRRQSSGKGS